MLREYGPCWMFCVSRYVYISGSGWYGGVARMLAPSSGWFASIFAPSWTSLAGDIQPTKKIHTFVKPAGGISRDARTTHCLRLLGFGPGLRRVAGRSFSTKAPAWYLVDGESCSA
eukprot:scaffold85027_cov69-Phaeocystis_antarctica.AAC.2